jgi:hypothetical protein
VDNDSKSEPHQHTSYSASDWWHNVLSVRRSSALRAIRVAVLAVAVWSTLLSLIHHVLLLCY